ncbi:recombinase family protein [Intestinibacillus sp. NTUH-41-i26]|uniref:recombinase family protein n=1 Tax=Butyricicoccaceae TaxID=3085642 RepID=UPI000D1EFC05|nr:MULTISPECIES: recombinase family protein [Butyricicoccaceae]WOC74119.1 recombinase family protein [Intestinibacillus sp. NTUH-41-i26]
MRTGNNLKLAFAYLRLSNEEARNGESSSIANQRQMIRDYCQRQGIALVREFVDDGYSGGNFDRPAFQDMLRQLDASEANMVITKDLSRLGRDMREASYYAEQFFPERGIRYLTIADNFDTAHENVMAPFQFAMNEVYLRDGSRKVKDVLRSKRENGQYCACPPYGYRKDPMNKNRLSPDEQTAPVVQRIFDRAASGDSSRKIALDLNADGVIPPLKYRVLFRDDFSPEGAARASDLWNYTTVKRILKNPVYLGHTMLGKSRKVSVKSKKKIAVPKQDWAVTHDTHPALITLPLFEQAQRNLGRGRRLNQTDSAIRKSIFAGLVFCARCGHALCSCGTVYKGEREKYWYLSCTHQRSDIANRCAGVRVKYADLAEVVRRDLNELLALDDTQAEALALSAVEKEKGISEATARQARLQQAQARLLTIDKVVAKLYTDNAEGRLDDDRLTRMVAALEQESAAHQATIAALAQVSPDAENTAKRYQRFFTLAKQYSQIDVLDRETLLTFIERIEVGPKEFENGLSKATHRNTPYRQCIRIFYRFIGELDTEENQQLPASSNF